MGKEASFEELGKPQPFRCWVHSAYLRTEKTSKAVRFWEKRKMTLGQTVGKKQVDGKS